MRALPPPDQDDLLIRHFIIELFFELSDLIISQLEIDLYWSDFHELGNSANRRVTSLQGWKPKLRSVERSWFVWHAFLVSYVCMYHTVAHEADQETWTASKIDEHRGEFLQHIARSHKKVAKHAIQNSAKSIPAAFSCAACWIQYSVRLAKSHRTASLFEGKACAADGKVVHKFLQKKKTC